MTLQLTRRSLVRAGVTVPILALLPTFARSQSSRTVTLPVRWPGQSAGDGFFIRHGYACENTWYNPGWWHTGEDWYALEDAETGGAEVIAVADGRVVFSDSDYPGRVVIVEHDADLYSMYGHLDYALDVADGQSVAAGDRLGTVLYRTDGRAPSHLHFEMRRFLFSTEVNGDAPRYGVGCGYQCAPGPGYWPIDAPEHPSAIGWLNPTHQLARMMDENGLDPAAAVVVNAGIGVDAVDIWPQPSQAAGEPIGTESVEQGASFPLLEIAAGDPASTGTSADAYDLWYRLQFADDRDGWIQTAIPSNRETGSDGRPSSVLLPLLTKS